MEIKSFAFELKGSNDATGEFEGYLAVFGNTDSDSDVVVKGAFKVSIASKRTIVILWQHIQTEPIGLFTELKEDDYGLFVKGKLAIVTAQGARAYALLKMGALSGLSIGYVTIQSDKVKGVRYIKECKLMEGSIVTFPANTEAVVTDVKSAKTKKVDGEDLHSSAFAWVGDPAKPDTWKLPIHFSTPEVSAAHIRDALSRFSETEDIPEAEKPRVHARIMAAAHSHGIDVSKAALVAAEKKMTTFKDALAAHELRKDLSNQKWMVEDAKDDSMDSIMADETMDKIAKKKAARKVLHDAADAHADIQDQRIDAMEEIDPTDGKNAGDPIEVKAAKKAQADADSYHVAGEQKCMKAMDLLHQASRLHTKGIVLGRQLTYAGITANDDKNAAAKAAALALDTANAELLASLKSVGTKLAA